MNDVLFKEKCASVCVSVVERERIKSEQKGTRKQMLSVLAQE